MSKWLFNIFVIPFFYFLSILPFWLLHGISDIIFFIVFYLTGYRKKVVMDNLRRSFPEKTEQELKTIMRQFYHHLCDVIVETLKLMTISKSEFLRRFEFTPYALSVFHDLESRNQSVIGVMGHCGNWEWGAIAHQFYFRQLITGVYHPLSNKNFDAFMLRLRGRMGGNIVAMNNLLRELVRLKQNKIPTTVGLIADQTPPPESAYWITFLNQDTPVFSGPEKIAKKFNYPVVYVSVKKKKRSFYEMNATVITMEPNSLEDGVITDLHSQALEKNIREQPYIWLWSHRRWKHKRPKGA